VANQMLASGSHVAYCK